MFSLPNEVIIQHIYGRLDSCSKFILYYVLKTSRSFNGVLSMPKIRIDELATHSLSFVNIFRFEYPCSDALTYDLYLAAIDGGNLQLIMGIQFKNNMVNITNRAITSKCSDDVKLNMLKWW